MYEWQIKNFISIFSLSVQYFRDYFIFFFEREICELCVSSVNCFIKTILTGHTLYDSIHENCIVNAQHHKGQFIKESIDFGFWVNEGRWNGFGFKFLMKYSEKVLCEGQKLKIHDKFLSFSKTWGFLNSKESVKFIKKYFFDCHSLPSRASEPKSLLHQNYIINRCVIRLATTLKCFFYVSRYKFIIINCSACVTAVKQLWISHIFMYSIYYEICGHCFIKKVL